MDKPRIGWIGTGVMGQSMAGHLLDAGYELSVFNRTAAKAQSLVDRGAHLCSSPREVGSRSDVVFSIVGYFYVKNRGKGRFARSLIPQVLDESSSQGKE